MFLYCHFVGLCFTTSRPPNCPSQLYIPVGFFVHTHTHTHTHTFFFLGFSPAYRTVRVAPSLGLTIQAGPAAAHALRGASWRKLANQMCEMVLTDHSPGFSGNVLAVGFPVSLAAPFRTRPMCVCVCEERQAKASSARSFASP